MGKQSLKKIMIFGLPGSGKSTFALKLSKKLNLPVYHLDRYFYVHHWIERNKDDFLNVLTKLVEKESWIIEGNAINTLDIRYANADIVLYFKFNRMRCLWRLYKRLFKKDPQICDRAPGCTEKVRLRLISYMWKFDERVRKNLKRLKKTFPNTKFIEVTTDEEAEQALKSIEKAT